ncbi:MAG: hypothetical protein V4673_06885 [Pseudomonadota bacterium]
MNIRDCKPRRPAFHERFSPDPHIFIKKQDSPPKRLTRNNGPIHRRKVSSWSTCFSLARTTLNTGNHGTQECNPQSSHRFQMHRQGHGSENDDEPETQAYLAAYFHRHEFDESTIDSTCETRFRLDPAPNNNLSLFFDSLRRTWAAA